MSVYRLICKVALLILYNFVTVLTIINKVLIATSVSRHVVLTIIPYLHKGYVMNTNLDRFSFFFFFSFRFFRSACGLGVCV